MTCQKRYIDYNYRKFYVYFEVILILYRYIEPLLHRKLFNLTVIKFMSSMFAYWIKYACTFTYLFIESCNFTCTTTAMWFIAVKVININNSACSCNKSTKLGNVDKWRLATFALLLFSTLKFFKNLILKQNEWRLFLGRLVLGPKMAGHFITSYKTLRERLWNQKNTGVDFLSLSAAYDIVNIEIPLQSSFNNSSSV